MSSTISHTISKFSKQRHFAFLPLLSFGLLIALLAIGLTACGSTASDTGTGSSAGTTPTSGAALTQKCGMVNIAGARQVPTDSNQAKVSGTCFFQAYQQCKPAMLMMRTTSVDAGMIHTFTIKNVNNKCTVSDLSQHFVVPNPPSGNNTYTCSGVAAQTDGIHITGCGSEGDIVIPTNS